MLNKNVARVASVLGAAIFCCAGFAAGYQEVTPVSVYTADNGDLYIVSSQDLGANGCTQNKNSILLRTADHSDGFIRSSLSVSLAAVASGKDIKVYWDGCLSGGRPKASLIGFGTAQVN